MKGYKAFNKGLICGGKRYAENTVFEETTEICGKGMHFCKNPLDVLKYYPLVDGAGNVTEFAEVETLDDVKTDDNKNFCTKKLKIGKKLSLWQLKSQIESSAGETPASGDYIKLIGGHYAKLIGGKYAKLVGDDCTTLVGGNDAKLIGNYEAKLIGGNNATLVGGKWATLVGSDNAKLIGDYKAKLVGGDNATLVGDKYATLAGGENAIIVGDDRSVAKGKKGAIILLIERDDNLDIVNFKAVQVDGKEIEEDVLYKLENGKLIRV